MKKFILVFGLILASSIFETGQAQHISVNINIDRQPAWGPVGYDYVDYYYIPEINVYYNVPLSMFYYWDKRHWVSSHYLPYAYRHYDLYGMYKVVLNMNNPWKYNRHHIRDYARYKGVTTQHVIYYTKDNRYNHSRRNTVSWYKGDRLNKPSQRYNNIRSSARSTVAHKQNRVAQPDNNKVYNKNNRSSNNRHSSSHLHAEKKSNARSSKKFR